MSWDYDEYLYGHINNVVIGFEWIINNIPDVYILNILPDVNFIRVGENVKNHDMSKNLEDEYKAYDDYFYGERTQEVKDAFNLAWLKHIHRNPHHWQHWVLIQDKGNADSYYNGKIVALDMPDDYILEMICDWWSFSWKKHADTPGYDLKAGLYEIFNWYDSNKDKIIFSNKTRTKVEKFLDLLHKSLDEYGKVVLGYEIKE